MSCSRFDSMPAQPPTPPKDVTKAAVDDAIRFLDDGNEIERGLSRPLGPRRPSLQAAEPSPAPSQESTSTSLSKKVGFSPHAIFHELPAHDRPASPLRRTLRRSPSARSSKPLRSILKATLAPPLTPDELETKLSYFSPDVPGSFAKMLQSVLSQLASDMVSNRLDAYMTLNGALQAYNDIPDATALAQKLGLVTQFLSRDIAWKNSDGKLNTNIVVQALKLTNFLLFHDALSAAMDTDFRCFLVDRSAAVIESTEIHKQIMKAHIHLLAQPKLSSAVMAASRADRILNALQTVDRRCSGNNVISTRLVIYQRLLEQAPTLMLTRIRDWLEQTFHCLLSSVSDVRGRAIDTCTKGGVRLGTQASAAKGVSDFLDTEIEEGQTYFGYFSTKLLEMLADKELAPGVPRIWAALVLYFRNKRKPLEKWTGFRNWLNIIQKCLNSSDIAVRYEATLAWNKLVYTTTFDLSLSPGIMKMLKTPIVSGMERRGNDAFSKQIRQYTMDCYCNLLHYGLRPELTAEEHEAAWNVFVQPILSSMVKASPKGRMTACRILYGLTSGNNGQWNANAALMPTPIRPEELPRLDPRWIRSHLDRVLSILQPATRASLWSSPHQNLALESAWAALMQTVSAAGAQEVKTTPDLKQAVALLLGFFRQLWSTKSSGPVDSEPQRWLTNYVSMVDTMVTRLGAGHLIEEYLTTSSDDLFEVAPTPSLKRQKTRTAPQAPMMLLLKPFFASGDDAPRSLAIISNLLERFVLSRPSPLAQMELLSRSLFALRGTPTEPVDGAAYLGLWQAIAKTTISALGSATVEQQPAASLGQTLRHSVDIVNAGLEVTGDAIPTALILQLYDAAYDLARTTSGEGGVVIAIMEPVCKGLSTAQPSLSLDSNLRFIAHVLSKAVWPKNRQSIENARKTLWGVGLAPYKVHLFDPFDHVYSTIVDAMTSMYTHLDADGSTLLAVRELLPAVMSFLETAPVSLLPTSLRRTQEGFALWVKDEDMKISLHRDAADQVGAVETAQWRPCFLTRQQITATWTAILTLIKRVPSSDTDLIKSLEMLLAAGFASPHRQIVNETIVFWNAKFGTQDSLHYPPVLESVLRARMMDVDIELPAFPDSNVDLVPAILPEFYEAESQTSSRDFQPAATRRLPLAQSEWFTAQRSPAPKAKPVPDTIDRRSAASGSSTPKARLRHDDSQVQFAPIDSSPIRFEESQHLTEHQKEVQMRQSVAAQMFPEMSSSPMAQSTALPRALPKRLDFSSEARAGGEDGTGTPTGIQDAAGLMSDDLPSSPTPSSTKDAGYSALNDDDDQTTEDEADEPPSSPPRSSAPAAQHQNVGPDDTTVGFTIFDLHKDQDAATRGAAEAGKDDAATAEDQDHLPSDSILPTEQLQQEAEAAEGADEPAVLEHHAEPHVGNNGTDDNAKEDTQVLGTTAPAADVTRVEDSFIGNPEGSVAGNEDDAGTPSSRRSTRKRKRSESVMSSAKKQKSASPIKRFFSRIWSASQQDDEEIGEEIVVASSQRSPSPESARVTQTEVASSQQEAVAQPVVGAVETKKEAMAPPSKRRPGRPRKSATPTPSVSSQTNEDASQTRSLKRSNASAAGEDAPSSFVKDTPAPAKSRKGRKSQTASQASQTSSPQQSSQAGRLTRRKVTAVLVSPLKKEDEGDAEPVEEDEEAQVVEASAPEIAVQGASTVEERPKLTPRSILGRLKDVLSDFVGMKVTAAEAREIDDTLYEFRRETFEAERRGRED